MSKIVDDTALIVNSNLSDTCKIYKNSRVKESLIYENVSVGDFSKVDFSELKSNVRIDRFNQILGTKIERRTYTGQNTIIMYSTIGKFCSISWNVTIGCANHNYHRLTSHSFLYNDFDNLRPKSEKSYNRFLDKCIIGNDVWIGAGVTVLRNVVIGDGAVIGAGAVVTKDVPPYAIVVGNPAKVIKYRFSDEIIKELLELKWWNFTDAKIQELYPYFEKDLTIEGLKKLKEKVISVE